MSALLTLGAGVGTATAQQILLDKPVKAGELTLFPDLNNESIYYYVPDKARIATDAAGTPQFSFLRYVENVRSGADQAEAREGEGGGILHALVTLGVTPEQLADANRELQRVKAGARIQGPVVFKSGRFGLVSSFTDTKGNLTKQVVGLGNAPLLDGEKAAVSMQLTKLGAKILWQSFEMPTPDISFHFEMDMSGFRSPKRATIDADWSKVYSHRSFGAGVATSFLAAEIKDTFDELRTTDAIKITQVGEDDKMDAVVATAYKMIQDRMFEPFGGTGTPSISSLAGSAGGQPSLLDRATTRLKEAAADVKATNAEIRKENDATRARDDKARVEQGKAAGDGVRAEQAGIAAQVAEAEAEAAQRRADAAAAYAAGLKLSPGVTANAPKPTTDEPVKPTPDNTVKQPTDDKAKDDGVGQPTPNTSGGADAAKIIAGGNFEAEDVVTQSTIDQANKRAATARTQAEAARAKADKLRKEADGLLATAVQSSTAATPTSGPQKQEKEAPTLSIVAMLEMKKVKQSGTFHFDMNKYTPDNMVLSFSENIGDFRSLKGNSAHFREVNLDDPLFKQRELVAMVDVANAQDFGQFVNFVNVQMRKKHATGELSDDEVRVDRNNFNKEGNAFKLMYGWKGDDDRRKWMEYEYQATWNLIGGRTVVQPWKTSTSGTIGLAPPYRRRTVTIDGSPETLQQADVRAVTVQVFYDVAGAEQSKQVTLNVAKGVSGEKVEILTAPDNTNYAYQMTWQLKGNKTLSVPRQTTVSDMLFVDELPAR
jgi:hypothetical protein